MHAIWHGGYFNNRTFQFGQNAGYVLVQAVF